LKDEPSEFYSLNPIKDDSYIVLPRLNNYL
jgi:hypothetical protein